MLVAHHGYKWWIIPLGFPLALFGAIPLAIALIYLGNRTYRACPQCGEQDLEPWEGEHSPGSEEIWNTAKAADDKMFARNKLVVLGVVLSILAAAIIFAIVASNA